MHDPIQYRIVKDADRGVVRIAAMRQDDFRIRLHLTPYNDLKFDQYKDAIRWANANDVTVVIRKEPIGQLGPAPKEKK